MAVLATITYNAASGSDTAASGGTLPATALTQAAFSTLDGTGAATTFTFNDAGTHDLTGGADDGSDILWVAGTTGERHLFRITSYTGGIATCTAIVVNEAIGATSITASNWAIGGKRASFENDTSRYDWEDWTSGWVVELDDAQTINAVMTFDPAAGDETDGLLHIRSSTSGIRRELSQAGTNLDHAEDGNGILFEDIKFSFAASSSGSVYDSNGAMKLLKFKNCELDGTNSTADGIRLDLSGCICEIDGCDIHDFDTEGVTCSSRHHIYVRNTSIHDCGDDGVLVSPSVAHGSSIFEDCLFYDNGGDGIDATNAMADSEFNTFVVDNCIFHANTGSGLNINDANAVPHIMSVYNSVFTENGDHGIDCSAEVAKVLQMGYNHFNNNTTSNIAVAPDEGTTTLPTSTDTTGDPEFVSVTDGAEDFSLRSTSPCRNMGTPVRRS